MIRALVVSSLCVLMVACAATPRGQQTATSPTVALPPAPPPGEPNGIAGLEESQLRIAFGSPAFVRKDGKSEMWRYDSASCKAFFFLYPWQNTMNVQHVETLPRGSDMAADSSCLNALRVKPAGTAPVS